MEKEQLAGSLGYFNLARGLGMVLILWGHSANLFCARQAVDPGPFTGAGSVLGGGVMAMFFLISGYSFFRRSPKKCLAIQTRNLLRPYGATAAAVLLTKLLLAIVERRSFWEHGGEYILTYLLGLNAEGGGTLFGIPVESVSILWFLLALFGGWVLYNGILQLGSEPLQWLLVGGSAVLGWLLSLHARVWPFCLPIMLVAVFFLAVGAQLRRYHLLEGPLPGWSYLLMGAVLLVSMAFGQVDMVNCLWRLGPLDILASCCCGFLLLRLYGRLLRLPWRGLPGTVLETVGFYSLWVVCLHCYEKVIVPWYRLAWLLSDWPLLGTALCLALRCLVMYGLYRLVSFALNQWDRRHRRKPKIRLEED